MRSTAGITLPSALPAASASPPRPAAPSLGFIVPCVPTIIHRLLPGVEPDAVRVRDNVLTGAELKARLQAAAQVGQPEPQAGRQRESPRPPGPPETSQEALPSPRAA
jgi:hypothetical protein